MPDDDRTRHLAAVCKGCNAAWVVLTLAAQGSPVAVVSTRLEVATCPDCGADNPSLALADNHARAVARLRADAALD